MKSVLALLALQLRASAALAVAAASSPLAKALQTARPVVVHVWDPKPAEIADYAIEDVSMACREAGASAVLVDAALVGVMANEQETAIGNFPGPVPVIADCQLSDFAEAPQELCAGAKSLGAAGIGIRYYEGDWPEKAALEESLRKAVAAAEESRLDAILLGEFGANRAEGVEGAAGMASGVGAAAALTKSSEDGAPVLGCWDGSEDELQRLRDAGFGGLIVKNACKGDVSLGAHLKLPSPAALRVTKLVKAALSKGDKSIWGGAGGVGIAGDGGDPFNAADKYYNNRS